MGDETVQQQPKPQELFSGLQEIRPGRLLYLKCIVLGASLPQKKKLSTPSQASSTTGVKDGGIGDDSLNIICIHGTASNHGFFLPLLNELHGQILLRGDDGTNNKSSQRNASSIRRIICWLYDSVGCGESPMPTGNGNSDSFSIVDEYSDDAYIEDLYAILRHKEVDHSFIGPSILMGHSYAPSWITKFLLKYPNIVRRRDHSTDIPPAPTASSDTCVSNSISGIIAVSSGVLDSPSNMINGGPKLFQVLPIWVLNCIQPLLTKSFLQMGFSRHTRITNPELIKVAQDESNANDMFVVQCLYRNHDWVTVRQIQDAYTMDTKDSSASQTRKFLPNLIIHGVEDEIIPIVGGQLIANCLNSDLLVVNDASHSVLVEQPKYVATKIHDFLIDEVRVL